MSWRSAFWLCLVANLGATLPLAAQFVAFNDHVAGSGTHSNATAYSILAPPSNATATNGPLRNIATGALLPVTLTISSYGAIPTSSVGTTPAAGTPAANTFNGFVDFPSGQLDVLIGTSLVVHAFSGLNPNRLYSFKGFALRNTGASTNRWSLFEIVGADSFVSMHSSNALTTAQVPSLTASQVAINTGQNYQPNTGDIAFWDKIRPGSNGTFAIYSSQYQGSVPGGSSDGARGYAITGLRLEELPFGINSQPQSQTVAPGDPTTFSVGVYGQPPIFYQWRRDGAIIQNATNQSFVIPSTLQTDAGGYSVLVSNLQFSTLSSTATLVVAFVPVTITAQPQSQTLNEGSPGSFSVSVNGSIPYFYQWFKEGVPIPGATNQSYSIASVSSLDAAPYMVVVSNRFSSAISSNAVLDVFAPSAPGLPLIRFGQVWRYDQSGSDLGTSWKENAFADSAWQAGNGVFHRGTQTPPEPVGTVLALTNASGSNIVSYYFRTHFNWPFNTANAFLIASNLLDDGAIFYLNGSEVARLRLPMGPVNFLTFASRSPNAGTSYELVAFAGTNLLPGDNVLAVEVHQASSTIASTPDVLFGLSLRGVARSSETLRIVSQPSDQTINEGQPAMVTAAVFGTPPIAFQWFKGGAPLPNATNQTVAFSNAHPANAGSYSFSATNRFNTVASSAASLAVVPDTVLPRLVSVQPNDLSTVLVNFSEPMNPSSMTNPVHYHFSPPLAILGIRLLRSDAVLITTAQRDPQFNYTLNVSGVQDAASSPNSIPAGSTLPLNLGNRRSLGGLAGVQTVFIILFENHDWVDIQGSQYCPYINGTLLPMASYCLQYNTPFNLHPSEPNYLWLEGGTQFDILDDADPAFHHIKTTNHLAAQLDRAGISWKTYQESISGDSCPVTSIYPYAAKHNPFVYFDDLTTSLEYCTNHMRPYPELALDLANNTVARYNFITPNLTNDMHDLTPGSPSRRLQGDTWLSQEAPKILNSQAFSNNGALFITWDEGGGDGPIGMIVLSPLAKGGAYSNSIPYSHSSTLRTFQDIFGLQPYLGGAATAINLGDLFKNPTLTMGMLSNNSDYQFDLTNLLPGRTNYIQASSDLKNWTTIRTNVSTSDSDTFAEPAILPHRFYRLIRFP